MTWLAWYGLLSIARSRYLTDQFLLRSYNQDRAYEGSSIPGASDWPRFCHCIPICLQLRPVYYMSPTTVNCIWREWWKVITAFRNMRGKIFKDCRSFSQTYPIIVKSIWVWPRISMASLQFRKLRSACVSIAHTLEQRSPDSWGEFLNSIFEGTEIGTWKLLTLSKRHMASEDSKRWLGSNLFFKQTPILTAACFGSLVISAARARPRI